MRIDDFFRIALRRNGKAHFVSKLNKYSKILDVGCGSYSPKLIRRLCPTIHYTSIDVVDHPKRFSDLSWDHIFSTPENFAQDLRKFRGCFDAVISSHNIEHCDYRNETIMAMLDSIKKGGHIFLSFPSEMTVDLPSRRGTLNYYDDPTHKENPPRFVDIINTLESEDFEIIYSKENYRPKVLMLIGALLEPLSILAKRVLPGTWEFYGFESVILARKKNLIDGQVDGSPAQGAGG